AFECGEVDLCGVELNLSEVRIHRSVEGQARTDPVAEIGTRICEEVGAAPEGIPEAHRTIPGDLPELGAAGKEGEDLEGAAPLDPTQPVQVAEARDRRALEAGRIGPGCILHIPSDPPLELKTPLLLFAGVESHLPKG